MSVVRLAAASWGEVRGVGFKPAIGYLRTATYPSAGDVIVLPNGDGYCEFDVVCRVFAATGEVSLNVTTSMLREDTERVLDDATRAVSV